jgi:hypothetical protein
MTHAAACFGELSPARTLRGPLSPLQWTAIGALAIPLWAMWPSLALRTAAVPPLETLTLAFLCGSISFKALHMSAGEPAAHPERSWRSWIPGLVYAGALSGGDVCFLLALHRIPAAQANLLAYLWPVMIVVMGAAVGLFRLRARQLLGLLLGFSGAVILIWDGQVSLAAGGIALALLSGALWAAYCVFRLLPVAGADRQPPGARLPDIDRAVCSVASAARAHRDARGGGARSDRDRGLHCPRRRQLSLGSGLPAR